MPWHKQLSQTPFRRAGINPELQVGTGGFSSLPAPTRSCWAPLALGMQLQWLPRASRSRFRAGSRLVPREEIHKGRDPEGSPTPSSVTVNQTLPGFGFWAGEGARTDVPRAHGHTVGNAGNAVQAPRSPPPQPPTSFSPSQPVEPPAPVSPQLFPSVHASFCPCPCVCVCVSVSQGWAPRLSPQDPGAPGAEGCFSFSLAGIQLLSLVFPFSFSPGIRPL